MKRRNFLGVGFLALIADAGGARGARSLDNPSPSGPADQSAGERSLLDFVPATQHGAIKSGASRYDIGAAVAQANAAGVDLSVPPGRYYVGASVTFTVSVHAKSGAVFDVAADQTVTFAAGFFANPFAQTFAGTGVIAFNPAATSTGYPEWWGARTGDTAFDCQPALTACVAACAITRLAPADYWIADTWKIQHSSRIVEGVNGDADGPDPQTRILLNSATLDIIQVGPDSQPVANSMSGFLAFIHLRHISVTRTAAVTAPPVGRFDGPAGFRLQWVTSCSFENLWSNESTNGFYIKGTVFCKLLECHGFRSGTGSYGPNDYFAAFLQDNSVNIGLNSGNASLYYNFCGATGGFSGMTASYGIYTYGGFTDTFVFKFETAGIQYPQVWNGSTVGVAYPAENLMVTDCVLDWCIQGIVINAAACFNAAVVIKGNYFGIGNPASTDAIVVTGTVGAISITANQMIGGAASVATRGLHILNSSGVIATGNVYTDLGAPIVLDAAGNCHIMDLVNAGQAGLTGKAAVSLTNSSRNVIDCTLKGRSAHYATGVSMIGAGNHHNEVRCTGLDPAAIVGGAANTLVSNGAHITTAGAFGPHNLATGILG